MGNLCLVKENISNRQVLTRYTLRALCDKGPISCYLGPSYSFIIKIVNITPWMMFIILKQPLYIPNCCSQGYYQYSLYFRGTVFKLGKHQLWNLTWSEWALSIRLVSKGLLFQLGCTIFGFSLDTTQYSDCSVVQIFCIGRIYVAPVDTYRPLYM